MVMGGGVTGRGGGGVRGEEGEVSEETRESVTEEDGAQTQQTKTTPPEVLKASCIQINLLQLQFTTYCTAG